MYYFEDLMGSSCSVSCKKFWRQSWMSFKISLRIKPVFFLRIISKITLDINQEFLQDVLQKLFQKFLELVSNSPGLNPLISLKFFFSEYCSSSTKLLHRRLNDFLVFPTIFSLCIYLLLQPSTISALVSLVYGIFFWHFHGLIICLLWWLPCENLVEFLKIF